MMKMGDVAGVGRESLVVNMNIVHVKIKKIRDVAMFGRCLEIKWEI